MASFTLSVCETMALRAGVLAMAPPFDQGERQKADIRYEDGTKALLKALNKRDDSALGRVQAQAILRNKINKAEGFSELSRAVAAVISLRRLFISKSDEAQSLFLPMIYVATTLEAERYQFPTAYDERIAITAYCAVIAHGPVGFVLPDPAPGKVLRPIRRVPGVAELEMSDRPH